MAKNLMGKTRSVQLPYATFKGHGPFGQTEMHVLKAYQVPANEAKNKYAKWMVAVKSDMTHGSYDMGDSYIREATMGLTLVDYSDAYAEQYGIERNIEEYI